MKTWVVRGLFALIAFTVLIGIVGARNRSDRAIAGQAEIRSLGVPSEVNVAATQLVSVWAGQPAAVISVVRQPHDLWSATAMVGPDCYEVVVGPHGETVSAHPGLVPCPTVTVAGSGADKLEVSDERFTLVSLFLDSWLRGDKTASRFLADSTVAIPPPAELATDVKVMAVYGDHVPAEPGIRSTVTATADVQLAGRVEALAWTFRLSHGSTRWSVEKADGGEVPSGDPADLRLGRTLNTIPNGD